MIDLRLGDCLDILPTLEAESVDTVITDPPYGLSFMGKEWDHGVPGVPFWEAALRVAKPGAMLCAFGGTRTHHRLMCAIEDAGWEIRDVLMYLYGSGFPKSHNIGKAIDKAAGAERKVVGFDEHKAERFRRGLESQNGGWDRPWMHEPDAVERRGSITAPATDAAALWDGYGTALKPAYEPIILAMKPLPGTFAQNALDYGVAGIWVDGCRVGTDGETLQDNSNTGRVSGGVAPMRASGRIAYSAPQGRWPANLLLDDVAAAMLDEQSGERPTGPRVRHKDSAGGFVSGGKSGEIQGHNDTGGASRYFTRFHYSAKASRSERELGLLGHIPCLKCGQLDSVTHINPKTGKEEKCRRNGHPTVKPLDVCRWLCRLTKTPTGGVVLDPFMGSGRISMAAILEGRDTIGIELERPSFEIAQAAVRWAEEQVPEMEQTRMAV